MASKALAEAARNFYRAEVKVGKREASYYLSERAAAEKKRGSTQEFDGNQISVG